MGLIKKKRDERRAEARYERREDLSIKVAFSSQNPELLGKTLGSESVDVSASGLRIVLNQAVEVNSILDVWVNLHDKNKRFFLTGNVCWCKELEDSDSYQAGLMLHESAEEVTDLTDWQALFDE